jgi:ELWxxDGT repeat protein
MKTSFWRRWWNSVRGAKKTGPVLRTRPRRPFLNLEALEDRVTPSLTPMMVADIRPGTGSPNGSFPSQLVAIGSTVYFNANDGVYGDELWKSDGTAAGTVLVKDIVPGWSVFGPTYLTNVNGTLFFTPFVPNGSGLWRSDGLWKSDGTAAGTVRVSSLAPSNLTNVNGTLFFTAYDGTHGKELWKSDGTATGTVLVKDINPVIYPGLGSYPSNLTNVNGILFFTASGGNGRELWQSDGTAAGTVPVGNFANLNASELTYVNGTWFFVADDGEHGQELWKSDGTTAGTTLVKDIYPGSSGVYYPGGCDSAYGCWEGWWNYVLNSSNPGNLTNVNGTLFFTAEDGVNGRELWKSDGTEAGTVQVTDIRPASSSSPSSLTNVNGTLYFTAYDDSGMKLWQSDGTAAGTVPVANFANFYTSGLTNVNGTWFFAGDDREHGLELWVLADDGRSQETGLEVGGFPATVTAGAGGGFTVTVKYADGTINTGYRGTVTFTSSDRQAVLPASYTFTEADQGVHTFTATLKTAGSQSITVRDNVFPAIGGTQTGITVTAAAASRFTVAGFPASVTAGVAGSFTVTARDAYFNRVTGYTGTVRFTSSDGQAFLPGNYTFTAADAGMHTFSATLTTAGYRSLTATDTANAAFSGTQGSILVNAAAASRLVLSAPVSVKANTAFSVTVTVVDAYGNVVTGYTGTLSFSSTDRTTGLPKMYTFTTADQGTHTFTNLRFKKKGTQTITVFDTLNDSLTNSAIIDVL